MFESFGTSRMDALTLMENTLNMKTIKIVDKMEDPSGVRKEISIMNRNECNSRLNGMPFPIETECCFLV